MDRRGFLKLGLGAAVCGGMTALGGDPCEPQSEAMPAPPTFSVIPVVADGKYVWTKPPEGQTGYLEPRPFLLSAGIELVGLGNGTQIKATTPLPVDCPEQKLEGGQVQAQGCEAQVRDVGEHARQLCLYAPQIAPGQTISAKVTYKATICKQYLNYRRDQFPQEQSVPADVRKQYLGESPGIQVRSKEVHDLLNELKGDLKHPWDLAQKFAAWIPRNIRPQIQPYAGVIGALEKRVGDCAEMSALFVALCRAAGIPARLVWVPNHNWSEMYLTDKDGKGHWLPVHTACYFWFGWTGAHELVIQKGDRLRMPDRGGRLFRLQEDWMQWGGRRPTVRYLADLTPQPAKTGEDPGPGARQKIGTGEWKVVGNHPLDRYVRR
ncbi:MAG: transglutaminase-like domain-containing protein [Thermoguttaceae bacterium]|jgi:hypothetical protein